MSGLYFFCFFVLVLGWLFPLIVFFFCFFLHSSIFFLAIIVEQRHFLCLSDLLYTKSISFVVAGGVGWGG